MQIPKRVCPPDDLSALLNKGMNSKIHPHPHPLPGGEGTSDLAPFSLGRRAGDEGNSYPDSATPTCPPDDYGGAMHRFWKPIRQPDRIDRT